jgi:hypothetical protein
MPPSDRRSERRPSRGTGGFGQIEVLTAMLIIGVSAPFVMGAVLGALTETHHSRDRGAATAWVQGELDFLRGQCYVRLRPSDRKVTPDITEPGELPPPAGFPAASVRLEVAGPALLRATVGLYRHDWIGAPTEPPFLAMSTYLADIRIAGLCS